MSVGLLLWVYLMRVTRTLYQIKNACEQKQLADPKFFDQLNCFATCQCTFTAYFVHNVEMKQSTKWTLFKRLSPILKKNYETDMTNINRWEKCNAILSVVARAQPSCSTISCDVMGLVGFVDLMRVSLSSSHWEMIARDNRVNDGDWWAKGEEKTKRGWVGGTTVLLLGVKISFTKLQTVHFHKLTLKRRTVLLCCTNKLFSNIITNKNRT